MTFLLQLRPSLFFFFPISFRFPLQHNLLFNAESIKRQTEEAVTWTTELLLADKSTSKTSHHSAYKGPPNDSCFRIVPTLGNSNNSQIP
ncbi:guanine nucleotide-binding protein G(I)/G(S)/G(O) subunit gamma-13 isoform X2 [Pelobates fuscus]|uniref:guanine nucleotide-binding protein G(I)/G(S)/G(O) subunit gamma-13 isoform X2 n=1 Tax=Pelobates fuscus TaxID=191477 RepID=UPI002FE4AC0E